MKSACMSCCCQKQAAKFHPVHRFHSDSPAQNDSSEAEVLLEMEAPDPHRYEIPVVGMDSDRE